MTRDGATAAALATIIAALVAGLTGWLTARQSAKGAVRTAQVTSLAELEREAGERASRAYNGVIDRLEREQAEDRREIAELRERVVSAEQSARASERRAADVERELRRCKDTCRALARRIGPETPL